MKSQKKKKKITIKDIIRLTVLLVAFSVLLYPTFSSYLNEKNGSKVVSYYDEESVKLSKAEKEQMLEEARAYNKEMLGNIDLIDPFSQEDVELDARYESLLNVDGSGMMGYIRIPKINVELPIYHGTSEAVLQAGVGHFWGTSLPVGGESTHDKEHDGELIETLQAYLDCDKSANKAAEKLYVNYRTLSGRLKKIKDISGIDFKNSAEMLAVRNGIVLFKMAETL